MNGTKLTTNLSVSMLWFLCLNMFGFYDDGLNMFELY